MRWGSYYVTEYYQVTLSKENNQQFSVGMDDMLETDRAFTSSISQLLINACKLQSYSVISRQITGAKIMFEVWVCAY